VKSAVRWYHVALTLFALLWVTGALTGCAHFRANPWQPELGSSAHIKIVNGLAQACGVMVQTLEPGATPWHLGIVAAHDSATFRLPYADQKVDVTVCGWPETIYVDGPGTWTMTLHAKKES